LRGLLSKLTGGNQWQFAEKNCMGETVGRELSKSMGEGEETVRGGTITPNKGQGDKNKPTLGNALP